MKVSTLGRWGSAALVTGVTTLVLAAPTSARPLRPAIDGPGSGNGHATVTSTDGPDWGLIGGGTAGAIALVGASTAAALGVRRHRQHVPHTAH